MTMPPIPNLQFSREHALWFVDYEFVYGTHTTLCADLYAEGLRRRVALLAPGAHVRVYAPGVLHLTDDAQRAYTGALAALLTDTPDAIATAQHLTRAVNASLARAARAVVQAEGRLARGDAPLPFVLSDGMAGMMTFSNLNDDLALPTWLADHTGRENEVRRALEPRVTPYLRVLASRAHAVVMTPTLRERLRYVQQAAFLATFDMPLSELPSLEAAPAHAATFAHALPATQRPTRAERAAAIARAARTDHQAALLRLAAAAADHEEARHYWQARGLMLLQRVARHLDLDPAAVSLRQLEAALALRGGEARGGGKAAGLRRLVAVGAPVPRFDVVPAEAFTSFGERIGVERALASQDAPAAAQRLRGAALATALPAEIQAQLAAFAAEAPGLVAVRSSSAGEDGAQRSAAGVHLSLPAVRPTPEALERAVKEVWLSAFTAEALAYHRAPAPMSVLLQDSVNAAASGVAFVRASGFEVESVFGQALTLVGGHATPDLYQYRDGVWTARLSREKRAVVLHATPAMRALKPGDPVRLPGRDATGHLIRVVGNVAVLRLGPTERSKPSLTPEDLERLAAVLKELLPLAGARGLDVEWAVEGGRVHVLQARPITTAAPRVDLSVDQGTLDIAVLADGSAAGEVRSDGAGEVLLLDQVMPSHLPQLAKARAVLIQQGGALSHGAILCRELGIPLLRIPPVLAPTLVGRFVTIDTAASPPLTTKEAA